MERMRLGQGRCQHVTAEAYVVQQLYKRVVLLPEHLVDAAGPERSEEGRSESQTPSFNLSRAQRGGARCGSVAPTFGASHMPKAKWLNSPHLFTPAHTFHTNLGEQNMLDACCLPCGCLEGVAPVAESVGGGARYPALGHRGQSEQDGMEGGRGKSSMCLRRSVRGHRGQSGQRWMGGAGQGKHALRGASHPALGHRGQSGQDGLRMVRAGMYFRGTACIMQGIQHLGTGNSLGRMGGRRADQVEHVF